MAEPARRTCEWRAVVGILVLLCLLTLPNISAMTLYLRGDALLRFYPFSTTPPSTGIPQHLMDVIDKAVSNALLAQVGRRDHALRLDGASIAPGLTTPAAPPPVKNAKTTHPADVLLRDNMHGGRCWHMPGKNGQVGIVVPAVIFPTHFTIDHLPAHLAYDIEEEIGQAPRLVRVWAAIDGPQNEERYTQYLTEHPDILSHDAPPLTQGRKFILLTEIEYDIRAPRHSQTFAFDGHVRDLQLAHGVFVFEVLDNWGAENTCIYRLRIHGKTEDN